MNGYYHKIDSPIGPLHLAATNDALLAIHHNLKRMEDWNKNTIAFKNDKNIPIQLSGTQFQLKAWDALNKIPYAKTVSYSEQAKISGNPKATRAIGNANNANPISIIVPCHRVIGKSGKLVGYGGGLDRKNYLLDLELKYD